MKQALKNSGSGFKRVGYYLLTRFFSLAWAGLRLVRLPTSRRGFHLERRRSRLPPAFLEARQAVVTWLRPPMHRLTRLIRRPLTLTPRLTDKLGGTGRQWQSPLAAPPALASVSWVLSWTDA